jgi:hypothetical protein
MATNYRYGQLCFGIAMTLIAGCGTQPPPQVANPVADALRVQARKLNQQSQACQEDLAEYRAQQQALAAENPCSASGFVQVGLSRSKMTGQCLSAMIEAVPACRQWAHSYQAMITQDVGNGGRAQEEITLMESEQLERAR